jgi:hypothetical protein
MAKYSETIPGLMVTTALEALAWRLNGLDLPLVGKKEDAETLEYASLLPDRSLLTLVLGRHGGMTTEMNLHQEDVETNFLSLCVAGDYYVRAGLQGGDWRGQPILTREEIPSIMGFLDRAREACLAAGGETFTLHAAPTTPLLIEDGPR